MFINKEKEQNYVKTTFDVLKEELSYLDILPISPFALKKFIDGRTILFKKPFEKVSLQQIMKGIKNLTTGEYISKGLKTNRAATILKNLKKGQEMGLFYYFKPNYTTWNGYFWIFQNTELNRKLVIALKNNKIDVSFLERSYFLKDYKSLYTSLQSQHFEEQICTPRDINLNTQVSFTPASTIDIIKVSDPIKHSINKTNINKTITCNSNLKDSEIEIKNSAVVFENLEKVFEDDKDILEKLKKINKDSWENLKEEEIIKAVVQSSFNNTNLEEEFIKLKTNKSLLQSEAAINKTNSEVLRNINTEVKKPIVIEEPKKDDPNLAKKKELYRELVELGLDKKYSHYILNNPENKPVYTLEKIQEKILDLRFKIANQVNIRNIPAYLRNSIDKDLPVSSQFNKEILANKSESLERKIRKIYEPLLAVWFEGMKLRSVTADDNELHKECTGFRKLLQNITPIAEKIKNNALSDSELIEIAQKIEKTLKQVSRQEFMSAVDSYMSDKAFDFPVFEDGRVYKFQEKRYEVRNSLETIFNYFES